MSERPRVSFLEQAEKDLTDIVSILQKSWILLGNGVDKQLEFLEYIQIKVFRKEPMTQLRYFGYLAGIIEYYYRVTGDNRVVIVDFLDDTIQIVNSYKPMGLPDRVVLWSQLVQWAQEVDELKKSGVDRNEYDQERAFYILRADAELQKIIKKAQRYKDKGW